MQVSVNPVSIVSAFFAGVLVSFTPCVYVFLPITLSYIGTKSADSKTKGFFLSFVYASGLALTFSTLGVIAALSGRIFGSLTQSAFFYILLGNIYLILGFSLLDVFTISNLNFAFSGQLKKKLLGLKGWLGVFVLGVLSGLVIGPCTTPVLGAILTFIAKERNISSGFILLASFAFGMSLLLILAGTFSGLAQNLPKSGAWNRRIKILGAILLIAGAQYFFIKAGGLL